MQAPEHSDGSPPESAYCPPAPKPQARPLKPLALLRMLKRNPLECWAMQHFEQPVVAGGLPIGHVLLVHEPGAIRHVLLDNAGNYRKDRFQRRVLSAGLNDGLLSAEGGQWRQQRRVIAPMFARRMVMDFTPAMMAAAEALVDRWSTLGDGAAVEDDHRGAAGGGVDRHRHPVGQHEPADQPPERAGRLAAWMGCDRSGQRNT